MTLYQILNTLNEFILSSYTQVSIYI